MGVLTASSSVKETLQAAGIKVKIDDTDQRTPGWKFNFYEMKVCISMEIQKSQYMDLKFRRNDYQMKSVRTCVLVFHQVESQVF